MAFFCDHTNDKTKFFWYTWFSPLLCCCLSPCSPCHSSYRRPFRENICSVIQYLDVDITWEFVGLPSQPGCRSSQGQPASSECRRDQTKPAQIKIIVIIVIEAIFFDIMIVTIINIFTLSIRQRQMTTGARKMTKKRTLM